MLVDRNNRSAANAKRHDRGAMMMTDRVDIRTPAIDLTMDEAFRIQRFGGGCYRLCISVVFHDIAQLDQLGCLGDRKQEMRGAVWVPYADMPKCIQYPLVGQDTVGMH